MGKCELPQGCSAEVDDLLMRLLEAEPSRRLYHAASVKQHGWFRNVDFQKVYYKVPQPVFPHYPPINPGLHLGQNFDACLDAGSLLEPSACECGTIAGFSK